MNSVQAALLCFALITSQLHAATSKPAHPSPPTHAATLHEMTMEQAFYYWVAVYGAPPDVVDRYAVVFDANNYHRAMADEFERARYRSSIDARIQAHVRALTFTEKYVYVSTFDPNNSARFGEYSFANHAFPVTHPNTGFSYFNYWVAGNGFDINPFELEMAVNIKDFAWWLQMPEATARVFLRSHPDRRLTLRIVYSVTRHKKDVSSLRYYLTPFIHSIDVVSGSAMATPIGRLARDLSSPGAWRGADNVVAGRRTIYYKGRYAAYWGTDGLAPSKGDELPSKDGAAYYRVMDYQDGKIRVNDYYITGEREMEGEYVAVCANNTQCPDGLFKWYYKNGYKRQEETFVNGKEMPYCTEAFVARFAVLWDEQGKCKGFPHKECPCTDQPAPVQSESSPPGVAPGGDAASVVRPYAITPFSAAVDSIRLFESGTASVPPPKSERIYRTTFETSVTRYINVEVSLVHPAPGHLASVMVSCAFILQESGKQVGTIDSEWTIQPTWETSYHWASWGRDTPGWWTPGRYHVDCTYDGKIIATQPFEVQ